MATVEQIADLAHRILTDQADNCESQGIPAARVSAIRHAANVVRMELAEQLPALLPVAALDEPTHTEWGVRYDGRGYPIYAGPFGEKYEARDDLLTTDDKYMPGVVVARQVTEWRRVDE